MYFSVLTLLVIGFFLFYYLRQTKRGSDNDLNLINLILVVSYIEKNIETHKDLKEKKHRYAFLIQYVEDIRNLKVSELNNKWIAIYNFFSVRTNPTGTGGQPIRYTKYGRISPDTIMLIADMYKGNSSTIGSSVWQDSIDYFNEMGKEAGRKEEYYYPKTIEEFVEGIEIYDKKYTGHVMMDKRARE